ncbi:MAG: hypothetical protein M1823_003011 [Watsoniomyces obsoletus]|nr:MAG: hypothetical protein M1823_003011 [Watsoniomyces obsoletus]
MEKNNLQTSGFLTTLDQARRHGFALPTAAGVKRTSEQRSPYRPSTSGSNGVPNVAGSNPARIQGDFKRPVIGSPLNGRLTASEIFNVDPSAKENTGPSEYTQRNAVRATPGPTQNPLLTLSHPKYDLPEALIQNFAGLGIHSIYPWQSSCLLGRGLLKGEKNLVYTAPTGGGKSLVADVLLLKRVIDHPRKKGILVLPYVALVQEKLRWLRRIVEGVHRKTSEGLDQPEDAGPLARTRPPRTDIRVAGFFGGSKTRSTLADVDIAVCTIEKANALVNTAIEECSIGDLGVLVLDELHMVQDDHRGYLLELMATKIVSLEQGTQIIGMSATLSNTADLARWLDAKFYESKYRPIPIEEFLVYENQIYPASSSSGVVDKKERASSRREDAPQPQPCRRIAPSEHSALRNPLPNAVLALTLETVEAGYGALVFCGSRKACELNAVMISEAMPLDAQSDSALQAAKREVLNELRDTSVGLDSMLEKAILGGVAFHRESDPYAVFVTMIAKSSTKLRPRVDAGLTAEERDIVAGAFDQGVIKVIVATCSLAAGINLPARRVILHGARMGRDFVGPALLRQMRGRAGRKGKDELGETYLCCQKSDLEAVTELLEAELPVIESGLMAEKRGIKRALLEVIVTGLATSRDGIDEYMKRTLLASLSGPDVLAETISSTIESLESDQLITAAPPGTYRGTQLGQAIVAASMTPEDGMFVHEEIVRALRAFVMDTDLHVFYMFTPIQASTLGDINWIVFRDQIDLLDESGLRVLRYVGVSPGVVNRMAQGGALRETTPEEVNIARVYRRFYAALQLRDLCNEMPVHVVAKKYDMPRGAIQNLSQTCEGFAAGIIKFCQRMGWGMLAAVLEHMSDRLKAGARADLLDLAKITFVKSRTARAFWESGLRSVRAVAEAEPSALIPILLQVSSAELRYSEIKLTPYSANRRKSGSWPKRSSGIEKRLPSRHE